MRIAESETLRQGLPHGLVIDFDKMFPEHKGRGSAKANRKRLSLLKRAAPVLRSAVEQEEKILYLAQGMVNNFLEQYFAGWTSIYRNQTLVVATDRRFLLIHCDRSGRPCQFANEVPYKAITKLTPGGTLYLFTITWKKANIAIASMGKRNGKRLCDYRTEALTWHVQSPVERNEEQRNYLCPTCYTPIGQIVDACPRCRVYFKSPKIAALRSLILPGLGDLYLGQSWFAIMQMMGAAMVITLLLTAIFVSKTPQEMIGGVTGSLILMFLYHGIDSLLTLAMAKKGLMAEDRELGHRE
ncbi:MAG TPA: hypothetical protein VFI02_22175 [Armatimonadota bacterium]|nr:hypothetical protein [Armatimonadota bacterium]